MGEREVIGDSGKVWCVLKQGDQEQQSGKEQYLNGSRRLRFSETGGPCRIDRNVQQQLSGKQWRGKRTCMRCAALRLLSKLQQSQRAMVCSCMDA